MERNTLFNSNFLFALRDNRFDLCSSLSEFIDNSIDAGANEINISIQWDEKSSSITEVIIADDGCGMDPHSLQGCLVLGASGTTVSTEPIGRFGMGLTTAGISIARRIDVFSRTGANDPFLFTYIDLNEIENGNLHSIPVPTKKTPPTAAINQLKSTSGTIIVVSDCDRLQYTLGDNISFGNIMADVRNYIGRTFRKFINGGRIIKLHDGSANPMVYLHDPLYRLGPTEFDTLTSVDPKAEIWFREHISLPVPNSNETANVAVVLTLLPYEWRQRSSNIDNPEIIKRRVPENIGFSILRANREVYYGILPKINIRPQENDCWWGCEISFPSSLDEYFQVKMNKNGAVPIQSLSDKLRSIVSSRIQDLQNKITNDFLSAQNKEQLNSFISIAGADTLKGNEYEITTDELERILKLLCEKNKDDVANIEAVKQKVLKQNYIIKLVEYPQNIFFVPEFVGRKIIIFLNIKHPFNEHILNLIKNSDDSYNLSQDDGSTHKQIPFDSILLIILSYCKAISSIYKQDGHKTMNGGVDTIDDSFLNLWGTILAAAIDETVMNT